MSHNMAARTVDTVVSRQQRRTWPKSKTECRTCRSHNFRCDETKPVCRRCISSGSFCTGALYQGSSGESSNMTLHRYGQPVTLSPVAHLFTKEPIAEDWHILEAFSWRHYTLGTYYKPQKLIEASVQPFRSRRPGHPLTKMTVASIFMMRLLSSTTDELYFPKNDHTTASLWNGFYCWMQQSFEDLNYDLANVSGNLLDFVHERQIPWRIALLMNIDAMLGLTTWRAHLEGFLTLLTMCGNPSALLKSDKRLWGSAQAILGFAMLHNTLIAPQEHITSIYCIGEETMASIWGSCWWDNTPFPTVLFRELVKITKLRELLWLGTSLDKVYMNIISIFQRIDQFDPYNWTESYEVPNLTETHVVGKMLKLSVTLYGLASLPGLLSSKTPSLISPGKQLNFKYKEQLTAELLYTLQKTKDHKKCGLLVYWPISVLGTCLAGGSKVDQDTLQSFILNRKVGPIENNGYILQSHTLRDFWASGQTDWDECWKDKRFLF